MMHVLHILTLGVALAAETVLGHMNMANPPPLRYKGNPNAVKAGKVDSDITSPNTAATFPCKGALSDLDDPVAGAPVATWYPGEQHTVQIVGGASHNGGSCQLSLSYDKGQTFTVVFSKIGACPTDPNIPFTLPADTPSADKVLFSWSWINHTGNREFYNNCAVLTIGAAKKKRAAPAVAFKDRPPMLVADIYHVAGAACVKEGVDALYPEPGPDFVNVSTSAALPDDCVSGQPLTANPVVGGSGGSLGAPGASWRSGSNVCVRTFPVCVCVCVCFVDDSVACIFACSFDVFIIVIAFATAVVVAAPDLHFDLVSVPDVCRRGFFRSGVRVCFFRGREEKKHLGHFDKVDDVFVSVCVCYN
ncbi:uncharacterized protein PG998_010140 [Apiospora kogelbergensis]|uniref:uncharacterized protein n=1 Tax=Apiospora kogelbergensis TaxID=1337665 RepID=UPI00312D03E5